MRKKDRKQMPLMITGIDHPHAEELKGISDILKENPIIYEWVLQDLTRDVTHTDTGAEGMTAEQVVRAAIIKQMEGFSYEDLAFHLLDSLSYRRFCRIGFAHKGFQKSALCHNIKSISAETWEAINRILVAYGKDKGTEKGRQARIDCTVVCSNIHEPKDSNLLWDCVRVITRMLLQLNVESNEFSLTFSDHSKRAKKRMLAILNANNEKVRKKHYRDLLKVTQDTVSYAQDAVHILSQFPFKDLAQSILVKKRVNDLKQALKLTEKVIEQTTRRVINGEKVPANEKIFSIFEPHTDIIIKDRRDTYYGHKICLSGGPSNLITDCLIVEGNPADSTLTTEMLDRQERVYGHYPLKVALDGGLHPKTTSRLPKKEA